MELRSGLLENLFPRTRRITRNLKIDIEREMVRIPLPAFRLHHDLPSSQCGWNLSKPRFLHR